MDYAIEHFGLSGFKTATLLSVYMNVNTKLLEVATNF